MLQRPKYFETCPLFNHFTSVRSSLALFRSGDKPRLNSARLRNVEMQFLWDTKEKIWLHRKRATPLVLKWDVFATILSIMRRQQTWGMTALEKRIRSHHDIRVADCRKALSLWQQLKLGEVESDDDAAWQQAMTYSRRMEIRKAGQCVRDEETAITEEANLSHNFVPNNSISYIIRQSSDFCGSKHSIPQIIQHSIPHRIQNIA